MLRFQFVVISGLTLNPIFSNNFYMPDQVKHDVIPFSFQIVIPCKRNTTRNPEKDWMTEQGRHDILETS